MHIVWAPNREALPSSGGISLANNPTTTNTTKVTNSPSLSRPLTLLAPSASTPSLYQPIPKRSKKDRRGVSRSKSARETILRHLLPFPLSPSPRPPRRSLPSSSFYRPSPFSINPAQSLPQQQKKLAVPVLSKPVRKAPKKTHPEREIPSGVILKTRF